jgi:hypothetical protein
MSLTVATHNITWLQAIQEILVSVERLLRTHQRVQGQMPRNLP